jgi:two-component system response regulator PilR (NtrC family)
VITAHGNVETAVRALKLGAYDFVSKPVKVRDLRKLVATALRLRGANGEGAGGRSGTLLGSSPAMDKVRSMIAKVARSQAPVHIVGESGTGKELVARLIHDSGPRASQPFVPVNCGAIPAELVESELFGHMKGSFTGATADQEGLIRSAEGGTVLLDEIADLPLPTQVKLLRVIQERTVRPVGDTREIPVDVRFLSATHQDLGKLVADGRFREDLYYRINVIELRVPPLRERGDDVIELAEHLLARLAERSGVETPELSRDARRLLQEHRFPGNVRELENTLERALALCEGGRIEAGDIHLRGPATGGDEGPLPEVSGIFRGLRPAAEPYINPEDSRLDMRIEDIERAAILQALEQARYNKTQAAKLLGISFRALRYRIKKLGIE